MPAFLVRLFLVSSFMLIAACNGKQGAALVNPEAPQVFLGVTSNGLEVLPETKTECWGSGKGCIIGFTGRNIRAEFVLLDCDDCREGWKLSKFLICPKRSKPESFECELKLSDQLRFGAYRDPAGSMLTPDSSGMIDLGSLPPSSQPATGEDASVDRFFIANPNIKKNNYYYLVQACPPEGSSDECEWLDPRWTNRGGGH